MKFSAPLRLCVHPSYPNGIGASLAGMKMARIGWARALGGAAFALRGLGATALALAVLGHAGMAPALAAAPDAGKPAFSAAEAAAAAAAKNEARWAGRENATGKSEIPRKRGGPRGKAGGAASARTAAGRGKNRANKPQGHGPAELERLLLASERPPTAETLRAFGPKTDERLIALAKGGNANPKLVDRAMSALAFTPTPAAIRFLEAKVGELPDSQEAKALPTLRRAAIALGWIAPASAPPLLERLYDRPEPEVRADASLALGLTRLPDAAAVLRKRLAVEPDDRVRALIARQLEVVEAALLPAHANGTRAK